MLNCENVQRTIKDLYKYAKEQQVPLLTDFSSNIDALNDFWATYVENYELLDKMFCTQYKYFRYFDQDFAGENPVEDVFEAFQDSVRAWLLTHDKSYTQLYKIELATNIPSPTSDYDITETKEGTITHDNEYVSGARSDSSTASLGQRTDVTTGQVMAYNSSSFMDNTKETTQIGAQSNGSSLTKGQQTDTEDKEISEDYTIHTTGSRQNPNETIKNYIEVWDSYSFYEMIFRDLCKAFLLV